MLSSRNIMFYFVFVCCIGASHVPGWVSGDIAPTDTILKVINEIFSCLKIKLNEKSNYKELLIHLVGYSRYKSNHWKEILRLTSINIKTDNSSTDHTSVINEVINRKNKTGGNIDISNGDDVNMETKNFLRKRKEVYLRKIPYRTLSNKTSQLLPKGRTSHGMYNKNTVAGEVNLAGNGTEDIEVWAPSDARRIFQGRQTAIDYYPFVASIHIFNQFTCAGSIIANDLVITAASCLQLAYNNRFYRESPQFLAVRVGSSFYGIEGDLIPVLEVYFHPSYDPPTLHNNLAIMRLRNFIRFREYSNVKKISIDANANALPWNTDGIVIVGWGAKTTSDKISSPIKNKIANSILDFYPLEECQEIYSKKFVTERHFCAGFISRGGGACNRDVGAPGLAGGMLVGVVSFASSSCGAADAPTVFTKLGFYTDWVEEIMAQEKRYHAFKPTSTYRPPPIHTFKTTSPTSFNFLIEPPKRPFKPISYDPMSVNIGRTEDRNLEFAELTNNENPQERAVVPSATTIQNYILRDKISKFTVVDKLLEIETLKTKSHVVNQLQTPVRSIGSAGLARNTKYTEATTETTNVQEQFVDFDTDDSGGLEQLLKEVNTELDMKYTEPNTVPQEDNTDIGILSVFPEPQLMEKESVSHNSMGNTYVADKKSFGDATKELAKYNFVTKKTPESVQYAGYDDMALQLSQIALPKKKSSEKMADKEVTFSDPELNQQINDMIDYINIIDENSLEQEYLSNVENNNNNINKLPEDSKILEIDDGELEPTEENILSLGNLNESEIDDDNLGPTEDTMLNFNDFD